MDGGEDAGPPLISDGEPTGRNHSSPDTTVEATPLLPAAERSWWRTPWALLVAGVVSLAVGGATAIAAAGGSDHTGGAALPTLGANAIGCPFRKPEPGLALTSATSCAYRQLVIEACSLNAADVPATGTLISDDSGHFSIRFDDTVGGSSQVDWTRGSKTASVQCSYTYVSKGLPEPTETAVTGPS